MTGMGSQTIGMPFAKVNFVLKYLYKKRDVFIFVCRVVSLSLCSRKECFISGSLDRTVLLWDQRAEKCQVWDVRVWMRCSYHTIVILN